MVAQEDSALHGFASNLDILSPLTPPTDQEVKSRNDMAIHKRICQLVIAGWFWLLPRNGKFLIQWLMWISYKVPKQGNNLANKDNDLGGAWGHVANLSGRVSYGRHSVEFRPCIGNGNLRQGCHQHSSVEYKDPRLSKTTPDGCFWFQSNNRIFYKIIFIIRSITSVNHGAFMAVLVISTIIAILWWNH